jgi:lipopolysaccharide export LptBFGC system permease protein LptF
MSILTRYQLTYHFKLFFTALFFSFFLVVFVRLIPLINFIVLGAPVLTVLKFFVTFFPLFFSIIIPLSSQISAYLFTCSISQSGELIAVRASGIPTWQLLKPTFILGAILSLFLTYVTSELETLSHDYRKSLYSEIIAGNALSIMVHGPFKMKNRTLLYPDKKFESGLTFAAAPNGQRLILHFNSDEKSYSTTITTEKKEEEPPSLLIENVKSSVLSLSGIQSSINSTIKPKPDYLPFAKSRLYRQHLKKKFNLLGCKEERKLIKKTLNAITSDLFRRFSLGFLTLTLSLWGFSQGLYFGRNAKTKKFLIMVFGTILCLITYFVAHRVESIPILSILLYIVPQIILIAWSFYSMHQLNQGVSSC